MAVVSEARSWIGTHYHHMGDVKGHGVEEAAVTLHGSGDDEAD